MMALYQLMALYQRCNALVVSVCGANAASVWWQAANYQFNLRTPLEQFELDPHGVYDYLLQRSKL